MRGVHSVEKSSEDAVQKKNPVWIFRNREGDVIAEIEASTKRKAFLEVLRRGVSLIRADLRRLDMRGLDLSGINLSGALMDQTTDCRGIMAKGIILDDAVIRGTRFEGSTMTRASFQGATIIHNADFSGVEAGGADFRHAKIWNSDFGRMSAHSALFNHALIKNSNFEAARMENADFSNARIEKSNFKRACLSSTYFGKMSSKDKEELKKYLPIRTRNAVILGCAYDEKTVIDATIPAFKGDKRGNRVQNATLWGLGALAIGQGVDMASETASHLAAVAGVEPVFGSVAITVGLGIVVKEIISDCLKDAASSRLKRAADFLRQSWKELTLAGKKKWDVLCLLGSTKALSPLRMALQETSEEMKREGILPYLKFLMADHGQIILCEKEHLAKALNMLANLRETGYRCPHPMTVVMPQGASTGVSPHILHFLPDGRSRVVWNFADEDRFVYADYNTKGQIVRLRDINDEIICKSLLPDEAHNIHTTLQLFERSALDLHGLDKFSYNPNTHRIEVGEHNAIVVRSRSNGRIGNHAGSPAIIPLSEEDHSGFYLTNGRLRPIG
jgi:uncharacterized protein YjbI with pentapeptide repeats